MLTTTAPSTPGRPHERAPEDLAQVVEQRVAAVLGRLEHARVRLGTEREAVGAVDAGAQQRLDGPGDVARIARRSPRRARSGRAARPPRSPRCPRPPSRGRPRGSRPRRSVGGLVERVEVDVVGAAVGVAQLGRESANGARSSTSGSTRRCAASTPPPGASATRRAAEVRGGVLPAVRAGEVDELARGERGRQALARLVVDQRPGRLGDRRVLAQQMAHDAAPLRLPMPSECCPRAARRAPRRPRRPPPRPPRRARRCRPPGTGCPRAISRQSGVRRSRNSRSMQKCLNSSPCASRMIARASRSGSTASRCSYQPIASASSVSDAHRRANVRVCGRQLLGRLVVLVEAHGRIFAHVARPVRLRASKPRGHRHQPPARAVDPPRSKAWSPSRAGQPERRARSPPRGSAGHRPDAKSSGPARTPSQSAEARPSPCGHTTVMCRR